MGDVDVNWVKAIGDIKSVARFCHSAFRVSKLFDESWNPDHVDLIVAAKKNAEDKGSVLSDCRGEGFRAGISVANNGPS